MSKGTIASWDADLTALVIGDVANERLFQHVKWGEQNHSPERWLAILGEEYGEVSKAVLHDIFGALEDNENTRQSAEEIRAEAIQVAAVAVAFVECLDRLRATACDAFCTMSCTPTSEYRSLADRKE